MFIGCEPISKILVNSFVPRFTKVIYKEKDWYKVFQTLQSHREWYESHVKTFIRVHPQILLLILTHQRQSYHHIETSHLICSGFYMMTTLVFNELNEFRRIN